MKLLEEFHSAILMGDGTEILSAIKPHPRLSPAQQFAIYAGGYRVRLIAAIRSDYPALLEYLGDSGFDALALAFIEKNPPTSYNLDFYPHKFAEFVQENSEDIFAKDLARLEGTIAEVFMLPDSEPLAANTLQQLSPEEFGGLKLRLRTAARLLTFSTNVHDWLTQQRSENQNHKPEARDPSHLLIYRHNNEVQRLPLSAAAFALLQQLEAGKTVATAIDNVENANPEYMDEIASNLQSWFAQWLSDGFFTPPLHMAALKINNY